MICLSQSHPSTVKFEDVAKDSKAFATMFSKRVRTTGPDPSWHEKGYSN